MSEPLGIYLQDHLGGAQVAVHLLEAMSAQDEDEQYREFAQELLAEIQADNETLRSMIQAISEEPSTFKNAGGWLLEKLSRLKLGHTKSAGLELFESLEMLSLGIAGKRSLWMALKTISNENPPLRAYDFENLLQRAEKQYEGVEQKRLHVAQRVFGSKG